MTAILSQPQCDKLYHQTPVLYELITTPHHDSLLTVQSSAVFMLTLRQVPFHGNLMKYTDLDMAT